MYGGYGYGQRGYGVDVNGDGVADYRVNPGVGVDVNGDGIADYRTGPTISPGPGAYMPGPHYGPPPAYGPAYGVPPPHGGYGYGAPGYY